MKKRNRSVSRGAERTIV
ncbi:MAG: hypothetical protein ACIPMY_02225 [Rickettsia endosymbiont of Pentastiridius leporinus]